MRRGASGWLTPTLLYQAGVNVNVAYADMALDRCGNPIFATIAVYQNSVYYTAPTYE